MGVELDASVGKHDGIVEGYRYFQARANCGLFVRAADVELENEESIGLELISPHRQAATRIQAVFRGHRSRRGSDDSFSTASEVGSPTNRPSSTRAAAAAATPSSSPTSPIAAVGSLAAPATPLSPREREESADHLAALADHQAMSSPRKRGHHVRNSSDLARVELESLLKRSSYLRDKPQIMHGLTKLIARRPSTVEMMRSGILATARGAPTPKGTRSPTNAANGSDGAPKPPRLGWAAGSAAGADVDPSARRLFVFGENTHGELSTGVEQDCFLPTEITLPPVKGQKSNPNTQSDFAQVCLGLNHMVVLTLANEVLTCGSWVANLLGTDDRQNLSRLKRLRQFEDLRKKNPANPIISIGCGDRHTVALHNDGTAQSFGGTLYGKLGHRSSGASANDALPSDKSDTYLSISALQGQKVTQMSAGNWHTCCVTTTGAVYSFGGGGKFMNSGQLGHGDKEDNMTPRRIAKFGDLPAAKVFVKMITCGGYHTLALTVDRLVYAWGSGKFGNLGLGNDHDHSTPQLVSSLLVKGSGAGRTIGLAAGENHSMCVQADGSVYSWGYGMQGQCLLAGTPVVRADGHRVPIDDVRVGDRLMADNGQSVCVTAATTGTTRTMFEIEDDDGRTMTVTRDHLVTLSCRIDPSWQVDEARQTIRVVYFSTSDRHVGQAEKTWSYSGDSATALETAQATFRDEVEFAQKGDLFEVTAQTLYDRFDILRAGHEDVKLPLVAVPDWTPRDKFAVDLCLAGKMVDESEVCSSSTVLMPTKTPVEVGQTVRGVIMVSRSHEGPAQMPCALSVQGCAPMNVHLLPSLPLSSPCVSCTIRWPKRAPGWPLRMRWRTPATDWSALGRRSAWERPRRMATWSPSSTRPSARRPPCSPPERGTPRCAGGTFDTRSRGSRDSWSRAANTRRRAGGSSSTEWSPYRPVSRWSAR